MARKREKYSHFICGGTLIVIPELAMVLGNVERAIILEQIYYYTQVLSKNPDNNHEDQNGNNLVWAYNTYKEWQEHDFPFMSVRTVAETFRFLVKKGFLLTGNFNKKHPDHTLWFTIHPNVSKNFDKLTIEMDQTSEKWQFIMKRIVDAEDRFNLEKDKWPRLYYTLKERSEREEAQREKEEFESVGGVFDEERQIWTNPEDGTYWHDKAGEDGAWVKDELEPPPDTEENVKADVVSREVENVATEREKEQVQIKESDKEDIDYIVNDPFNTDEGRAEEIQNYFKHNMIGASDEYKIALNDYAIRALNKTHFNEEKVSNNDQEQNTQQVNNPPF